MQFKPTITLLIALFLFGFNGFGQDKKTTDYITKTSGDVDFGKTDVSAYTPEIRENMKQLYQDKIGMFVHWGPYAQLEGIWDGKKVAAEWIMRRGFIPVKDYEKEAAGKFKPEKFNANDWIDIAENAGMKFIVLTAKHHDGFAMYKSEHPYNLVNFAGFGRDILKELSEACAKRDMKLGFYYSQSQDWHEKGGVGNHWDFESVLKPQADFDAYFNDKVAMQVNELTKNYGDIFMVWFDTPIQMDDEKCQLMMDIVKKNQPGALVNSRLGNGYGHFDVSIDNGKTPSVSKATWLSDLKVPWQTHESVTQGGWGYTSYGAELDRSADYTDFIYSFCRVVGNGGVYLLNVGPRPDGTIPEEQANSLRAIGEWLEVNGEAIYGADPSPLKFPPYAITSKPGKVYLHLKDWENDELELTGLLSEVKKAYCLADKSQRALAFNQEKEKLSITVPAELHQPRVTVIVLEIADKEATVIDETLQQEDDGAIKLPVSKCEYAIRRISYDYDKQQTIRWGENTKQGLIWTVNVKQPGTFKVISEDSGNEILVYSLITPDDTLELNANENIGQMTQKQHNGCIKINKAGVHKICVYPKITTTKSNKGNYHFKGLELVPVKQHANYPEFSWDHVPLYQHMRKSKAFTQKELEYLAQFPIITLEKTTGSESYGSTEKGSIEAATAIKKLNPKAKVLYYRNAMINYGSYDVNKSLEDIPEPFLKDSKGNTGLHGRNGNNQVYDLSNEKLRTWWLKHCVEMAENEAIDGIFIDGNIKALEPIYLKDIIGTEKKEQVKTGYDKMMADLRESVPNKLLLANIIRARLANSGLDYMQYFDGSYLEGFEGAANGYTKVEYVERAIAATQTAARNGKIICMSMGLGKAQNINSGIDDARKKMDGLSGYQETLTYKLAIFLICAEKYSYFLAHDGYSVNGDDSAVWLKLFPEYKKPLGPPKGPAQKEGLVYTREFEHASVWLDIENEKAEIKWKK